MPELRSENAGLSASILEAPDSAIVSNGLEPGTAEREEVDCRQAQPGLSFDRAANYPRAQHRQPEAAKGERWSESDININININIKKAVP